MVELKGLIIDNPKDGIFRVHHPAMTSPEILQMEHKRTVLDMEALSEHGAVSIVL